MKDKQEGSAGDEKKPPSGAGPEDSDNLTNASGRESRHEKQPDYNYVIHRA